MRVVVVSVMMAKTHQVLRLRAKAADVNFAGYPLPRFVCKVFKRLDLGPDLGCKILILKAVAAKYLECAT